MLKSDFFSKNKKFSKRSFGIYTGLGYLILTTEQFNSQNMGQPDKRKAALDSGFLG